MNGRSFWEPLGRAEMPVLLCVERVRFGGSVERATLVVTKAGEHGAVWFAVAAVAAGVDKSRRGQWLRAGTYLGVVYIANTALKFLARRTRPPVAAISTPSDRSFPSSHAVTSFAAARVFSTIVPQAAPALYVAAAVVTASRLHFCVHYPSDLIAGALVGEVAGRACANNVGLARC